MHNNTQMLFCKIGVMPYGDGSGFEFEIEADDDKGRKIVRVKSGSEDIAFEWHQWELVRDAIEKAFLHLCDEKPSDK